MERKHWKFLHISVGNWIFSNTVLYQFIIFFTIFEIQPIREKIQKFCALIGWIFKNQKILLLFDAKLYKIELAIHFKIESINQIGYLGDVSLFGLPLLNINLQEIQFFIKLCSHQNYNFFALEIWLSQSEKSTFFWLVEISKLMRNCRKWISGNPTEKALNIPCNLYILSSRNKQ